MPAAQERLIFDDHHSGVPVPLGVEARWEWQEALLMRVLIVDDDKDMLGILSRFFSHWGWALDARSNATDALQLFREKHYDLAVCDVNLPDGDGVNLAHTLLKVKPSTRILILSGDPGNLERARDSGLPECLLKPFEFGQLKILVHATQACKISSPHPDSY